MKVYVKGSGAVDLTQQHFVATGGQASVYVRNGIAYKVYTESKNAIPYDKFQALNVITDPNVIKPDQLLLDKANTPIGYTMRAVTDNYSLGQFFTKAFRDRMNVTPDDIVTLAAKLREHVENVHKAGVLIVDLNEFNILVPHAFGDVFLIDVDSYQTKGYPATVILPSVRDFSVPSKDFSPLSDWFSYGVLAFQLFVGIHPYRGTHPGSASVPQPNRLEHRMRNRISAFRSDVSLPNCCYPLNSIPQNFRDWLKAVLEDGKRLNPPDPRGGPAVTLLTPQMQPFLVSSGNLVIVELVHYEGWQLVSYAESAGNVLVLVRKGHELKFLLNGRTLWEVPATLGSWYVGFTPKLNKPVAFNLNRGELQFLDLINKTSTVQEFRADEISKSGDRFYVRNRSRVLEVEYIERADTVMATASHTVADVLELASKLYEGVALQNMVGSVFVSLFPRSKAGYQVKIPELDKYKIQETKFDGGVLMVVGAHNGQYDRLIFRFDEDYQQYDLRIVADITPAGLNFVTLATGICVSLTEEEKIEVFSSKKGSQGLKVVEDKALGNDMRLLKVGGKVGFERGDKLYQMSLK